MKDPGLPLFFYCCYQDERIKIQLVTQKHKKTPDQPGFFMQSENLII